jgi:peptide deformylase
MTVRSIRLWPDACLTRVCAEVDTHDPEVSGLITDLFDTMYDAPGRGLAAPQIGVLKRVFVVDVDWKEGTPNPMAFVNPKIIARGAKLAVATEQCLSIPATPMDVERPEQIELSWSSPDGQAFEGTFDGALARCIQHEFDHLNGTVIFEHQTAERRAELEAQYAA